MNRQFSWSWSSLWVHGTLCQHRCLTCPVKGKIESKEVAVLSPHFQSFKRRSLVSCNLFGLCPLLSIPEASFSFPRRTERNEKRNRRGSKLCFRRKKRKKPFFREFFKTRRLKEKQWNIQKVLLHGTSKSIEYWEADQLRRRFLLVFLPLFFIPLSYWTGIEQK